MTTYPIAPPSAPVPQSTTLKPRSVVAVSESIFTLQQQAQASQGQGWQIEVTLPPMKRPAAAPWIAFFLALNGREGTFTMGDADGRTPRGVATGDPEVSGAAQTGNSLVTTGWAPSTAGILRAGDYIQIGTRLHMVTADANSDADGDATLSLWPRLRESPADALPLIVNNTVGVWRLDEMPELPSDSSSLYSITFKASEALA